MTGKVPPKAPQPILREFNYHVIILCWKEYLDRLKEVFNKKVDGRILSEMQCRKQSRENWDMVYSGYDSTCTVRNLDPETNYCLKLRFKNNHGWGQFSEELLVQTLKQPLTGEDIHRAIRAEDCEQLVQILQKREANIEAQDNLDFTPLMASSQKGLIEFVRILLDWKADLEAKNEAGKTALMLAAFRGHIDCVQLLVERGARLDNTDKSGLGPLHYAVDGENPSMIRRLINLGADVNANDDMRWTPLIRCAGLKNNGNVKVAHELIRGGAEIDLQDNDGKTALHNAIINNHSGMCAFLLDKGASLATRTTQGNTAMELAESLDMRAVKNVIDQFVQRSSLHSK